MLHPHIQTGQYLSILGHDPVLALFEIKCVENLSISHTFQLFTKKACISEIPLTRCASVMCSAHIVYTNKETDIEATVSAIQTTAQKRKVSIFSHNCHIPHQILKDIKHDTRIKSISVFHNTLPNYGQLMSGDCFICTFTKEYGYIVARITHITNQQMYKHIDEHLPHGNLHKGIMNIKLARTLVNCSQNSVIFDPFAGFGRTAFSGNYEKKYILSDIDSSCQAYITENKAFYVSRRESAPHSLSLSLLPPQPAIEAIKSLDTTSGTGEFISLVTEGTLGRNFGRKVPVAAIIAEQRKVFEIWKEIFSYLSQHPTAINEIIFCVPYTHMYSQSIDKVATFCEYINETYTPYSIQKSFGDRLFHTYSRGKSFIGHAIIHVIKV